MFDRVSIVPMFHFVKCLPKVSEKESGQLRYTIHVQYFAVILNNLAIHARELHQRCNQVIFMFCP